MPAAEGRELGDPGYIIAKTLERSGWLHMGVQPVLRNIHSTDDLGHGNLPCAYDWNPTTVRSCVTVAKIPGSPTVVAGGLTGDIAKRRGRWPSASALSHFHRTEIALCRYKGGGEGFEPIERTGSNLSRELVPLTPPLSPKGRGSRPRPLLDFGSRRNVRGE